MTTPSQSTRSNGPVVSSGAASPTPRTRWTEALISVGLRERSLAKRASKSALGVEPRDLVSGVSRAQRLRALTAPDIEHSHRPRAGRSASCRATISWRTTSRILPRRVRHSAQLLFEKTGDGLQPRERLVDVG